MEDTLLKMKPKRGTHVTFSCGPKGRFRSPSPALAGRTPDQRVPVPAGAEDRLQELPETALAPAGVHDHEGLGANLKGSVGGGGGEPDLAHHREVVDVVPDEGDFVGGQAFLGQHLPEAGRLVVE